MIYKALWNNLSNKVYNNFVVFRNGEYFLIGSNIMKNWQWYFLIFFSSHAINEIFKTNTKI